MRSDRDVASGWIRKAESDLATLTICVERSVALDTACFHAQQAAEKYLKAYLTYYSLDFPFVHDLERLVDLCAHRDPSFRNIRTVGRDLTPYAVIPRYDIDFWPPIEEAREAQIKALQVKAIVLERLPPGFGS